MFLHLHFVTKTSYFLNSFTDVWIYSLHAYQKFTLLMLCIYFHFERLSSTGFSLCHFYLQKQENISIFLRVMFKKIIIVLETKYIFSVEIVIPEKHPEEP